MKITCDMSVTSARHRPLGPATPWYAPWNSPISQTAPGLVLDFSDGTYGAGGVATPLAPTMGFGRASDATRTGPAGTNDLVAQDIARIEYDASSLVPIGLLLEAARTNLFLQSSTPVDQTITVAAVPHVLSFYGTGTVTFAGAHVASITGTGAYPARTELGFTPAADNLTLSLSGSISLPQLEEGNAASSYVPTQAATVTRADDVASVPLGTWFNTAEGTLVFEGSLDSAQANDRIIEIDGGATTTRMSVLWNSVLGKPQFQVWDAGVLQAAIAPVGNSVPLGSPFRVAVTYKANDFAVSLNGGGLAYDTSGVLATGLTTLRLGRSVWGAQGLMLAESVTYYPVRLSDAEVQALSA